LALLAGFAGCDEGLTNGDGPGYPDYAVGHDLSVPIIEDLAHVPAPDGGDAGIADAAMVPPDASTDDAGPCNGGYVNSDAGDACPLNCAGVVPVADEGRSHIPFCTEFPYVANPPASGSHWYWPAIWGVHQEVLPREWWVHNLEHGGVVLLYNCPTNGAGAEPVCDDYDMGIPTTRVSDKGCMNEITQLSLMYSQHPLDEFGEVRIVVTSDPLLPTKFGAVAWDWSWTSDVFDPVAIQCLIDARYGRGPEPAP
jgi:hypothetical protein